MSEKKLKKEFLSDLYELINNLEDDLTLDLKEGEEGYKTYRESYHAVKKYTLTVLKQKIKKYERLKYMRKKTGNIYDTIKIPRGLTKKIDEIVANSDKDFTSRTDVIKFAVRLLYMDLIPKK